jgi:hypothetical protein
MAKSGIARLENIVTMWAVMALCGGGKGGIPGWTEVTRCDGAGENQWKREPLLLHLLQQELPT